ncbi:MAG: HEAT repeat domain-containing protein [Phycisphaerae bacterium]|nr:HEAT repeat domain-containing protein [Phycisphaerae bacterium]
MDHPNEKRLAARATALGESADPAAFGELADLTRSESALVRRLAASALGKLAGIVPADATVSTLRPLLTDTHPQVRQYAAKALGAFGVHGKVALDDLRDLLRNPAEKDYVKRSVLAAGKTIREAICIAERQAVRYCRRCGAGVDADEYARSWRAFQRVFCDKCFDEVYLERRNFDTRVELNKTVRARDGTLVQSDGERTIADYLREANITYRYDERMRIVEGCAIRPDFYLPEFDVYIEYWGMDTADYKIGMLKKQTLYQQEGKRLISLHFSDKPRLGEVLAAKLRRYVCLPGSGGTAFGPAPRPSRCRRR